MKIAILLPYGIFNSSNLQYKDYIDRATNLLLKETFDYLFLAGGYTNKDFPKLSEAQSILNYLSEQYPNLKDKIILEEKSFTTLGNLEFIIEILKNRGIEASEIIIACDSIRLTKVYFIAISLFNPQVSEEKIVESLLDQGIERKIKLTEDSYLALNKIKVYGLNINRSIEEIADQISNTLLEAYFIKYPRLHLKVISWKKKIWGLE